LHWFPLSLDISNWRNVVKPFQFIGDNSNLTIVFSRFKTWHDTAAPTLSDAQLTVSCRRFLPGEDPHPFSDLGPAWGIFTLGTELYDTLFGEIPLRQGCLVWDIIDNSAYGTETAFGGSLLTGLLRAVVNISSDGMTEGVDIFTGDPTFPGEYYNPGFLGTNPQAPWVVYEEGLYSGIESSEFIYYEASDCAFVMGGHSMPGVNEAISAAINTGGDFATSLINTAIAGAPLSAPLGLAIDLPPLGGLIDAVAKIFYEDVFLAFMQVPTDRAAGSFLPIAGLEQSTSGLGAFHYMEGWVDNADRAFTLSALLAGRAKQWATRAHTAHTIKVSDAAPYLIGEPGFGHFWLGSRIGTTVLGFPDPNVIFVERVGKIKYSWGKDGPTGWVIDVGYREPKDPALKAFNLITNINGAMSQLGVF
jgi:hypothetical protein